MKSAEDRGQVLRDISRYNEGTRVDGDGRCYSKRAGRAAGGEVIRDVTWIPALVILLS